MYNGLEIMKDDGRLLRIGEVADRMEVPVHTLRYWERMFKEELSPYRSRGGQRRYSEMDVEKIGEVKRLLKDEGYSINGARRVFKNGDRKRGAFSTHGGKEPDWPAIAQEVTRLLREKCCDR
jgi:DNA-binding transcriptional MerR regulator